MKKFGKFLTIAMSAVALITCGASILTMTLSDLGLLKLGSDEIRQYRGIFYSEGSVYHDTDFQDKGTAIGFIAPPTKDTDSDGTVWSFGGWDFTGDNIPDIIPPQLYFNFEANALFFKVPIPPDFSLNSEQIEHLLNILQNLNIQLSPEQLERLMEILKGIDIDWSSIDENILEQILDFLGMDLADFAEMLGLDFEDLIGLVNAPVFEFTASDYSLPTFFRTTSFKDYNGKKWNKNDYYPISNISEGSVNPLNFAADKISQVAPTSEYNITYFKSGDKYPVPQYELLNTQGLNSEGHSLENPIPNPTQEYPKASSYTTSGVGFYPASGYTIPMVQPLEYSSLAIENDEIKYREYVNDTYLNIDKKYKDYFKELASELELTKDDTYSYIAKINDYFRDFSMYDLNEEEMVSTPDTDDDLIHFLEVSKSGLSNMFATATTLLYRSIGVPARYVEGYFSIPTQMEGPPFVVGGLFAHSWVEIYVDSVGWMMVDTSFVNSVPDDMSEFLFGSPGVSMENFEDRDLERIEVVSLKEKYFVGTSIKDGDLQITAHYTNGSTANIPQSLTEKTSPMQSLAIYSEDFLTIGMKRVKVVYIEKGVPATCEIQVEVTEPTVQSITPIPGTYQSVYLPNNNVVIDSIKYEAVLENDEIMILDSDMVLLSEEIKTSTVGVKEYTGVFVLDPTIFTTIRIEVLAEPISNLYRIACTSKNITVEKNKDLDLNSLSFTATYVDGTYRRVTSETGTFEYTPDFNTEGRKTITIYYTERGMTVSTIITVSVVPEGGNLIFEIHNTKNYDGTPFDLENLVSMKDANGNIIQIGNNERPVVQVYYASSPVDNFITPGSTTFYLKLKVTNDDNEILTDRYFKTGGYINLRTSTYGDEQFFINDGDFEMDEEGYIDIGGFDFVINKRNITLRTSNVYFDNSIGAYFLDEHRTTPVANLYDTITFVSGSLLEGHHIAYEDLIFQTLETGDTRIDNKFIISSFKILDETTQTNVTKYYRLTTVWGSMRLLS